MGSSHSIEEVQEHVQKLKNEVQAFDGKITSKRYSRLQKQLIFTNARILKIKKSKKTNAPEICDQILDELSECLKDLTAKVTPNKRVSQVDDVEKTVVQGKRPKQDAAAIIEHFEKDIEEIENEVEKVMETRNYRQRTLVEAELKLFFTDLAITKTESGTSLEARKNEILKRLMVCYKQIRRDAADINAWLDSAVAELKIRDSRRKTDSEFDSDFESDFDSDFGKSSNHSSSVRGSITSKFYVPSPEVEENPKPFQDGTNKQAPSLSYKQNDKQEVEQRTLKEMSDYWKNVFIRHSHLHNRKQVRPKSNTINFRNTKADFDDLLNIDQHKYKETNNLAKDVVVIRETIKNNHRKSGTKSLIFSKKLRNAILDELLDDDALEYGNIGEYVEKNSSEIDELPQGRPPKSAQYNEEPGDPTTTPSDALKEEQSQQPQDQRLSQTIDHNLPHVKINNLRDKLLKLQDEMEIFSGTFKDREYLDIEKELQGCLEELRNIDDEGLDLIITSKEDYLNFIEQLGIFFEQKANSETQEDYYNEEESVETCGNVKNLINEYEMNKPKPPVVRTERPKKSHGDSDSANSQGEESEGEEEDDDEERSYFTRNSNIGRKILPPIVKQKNNSNNSENELEKEQSLSETPKRIIYPPIVKLKTPQVEPLEDRTTSDEESSFDTSTEEIEQEEIEEVQPQIIIKKIFAPIPKYSQNENTNSEQIPDNPDEQEDLDLNSEDLEENLDFITVNIVSKKIYPPLVKQGGTSTDSEPPTGNELNEDCFRFQKFIDEEPVEYQSNEDDSEEENSTEALNLNLLSKAAYIERFQQPSCSGSVDEVDFAPLKKEEGSDNDDYDNEVEDGNKEAEEEKEIDINSVNRQEEDEEESVRVDETRKKEELEEQADEDEENKADQHSQVNYMEITKKREIKIAKYIKRQNTTVENKYKQNFTNYGSKQEGKRTSKNTSRSIDYTQKIAEVREDIEELKSMNEDFKQTQDYKIYSKMQEKLMTAIKDMFNINKANFDNNSLVLYEIVSQDIQKFINEL